jgi:Zn-dependent protease with chaperone function
MTFLDWPVEQEDIRVREWRRKHLADNLLALFERIFPSIHYDLLWDSPTINAQAWRMGTKRYVRIYGGLVRHHSLTRAGIALSFAHETGHHLAGPPFDPAMRWMTWQGQADFWAASVAMPHVFGAEARKLTIRGAHELLALHQNLYSEAEDDEPDLSPDCRFRIFKAGASGASLPDCAKAEYQECFNRPYPEP